MNVILSICIPTYNRLDKLIHLLDKLKLIQHPGIEILVSDDSNNDDTEKYFYLHGLEYIKYYRNYSNMGQFKNCNACIARAKGEWIQILHDDDDIEPNYIETIFPYLSNKELVLLTGSSEIVELGKNRGVGAAHKNKIDKFAIAYDEPLNGLVFKSSILKYGNPFVFSHTIFRRETAISHGGFDTNLKFIGDLNLWLKLLDSGGVIFLKNKIGVYYLHDNNQLTSLDTYIQQSTELMILRIEMLGFVKEWKIENYTDEYKYYIEKNIYKAIILSSIIVNRNVYARFSYIRLVELFKKNELFVNKKWLPKNFIFGFFHLISKIFPDELLYIYLHYKSIQ